MTDSIAELSVLVVC